MPPDTVSRTNTLRYICHSTNYRSCCHHHQWYSLHLETCILVIRTLIYIYVYVYIYIFFFLNQLQNKNTSVCFKVPCLSSQYRSNQNRMPSTLKGLFLPLSTESWPGSSVCFLSLTCLVFPVEDWFHSWAPGKPRFTCDQITPSYYEGRGFSQLSCPPSK